MCLERVSTMCLDRTLIVANGLAKFRGRLKQLSYQTANEASRINLFIFLSKPIVVACWCLLIE